MRHFDRMVCSTADSFQDRFDVLCDPENILVPSAEAALQCQKVGVGACANADQSSTSVAASGLRG